MSDDLTESIIGVAIEVHRVLAPDLLESMYEEALCHELGLRGNAVDRQLEVDVIYKEIKIKGQKLNLLASVFGHPNREAWIHQVVLRQ